MKNTIITLLLALVCSGAYAQEARLLRQHDMKKWGIPAGNYSGITHISANRYALISDKQSHDGWHEVTINFDADGDIASMTYVTFHSDISTQGKARDAEGIVCPEEGRVFVSAESDQQIIELDADGHQTGRRLNVPESFAVDSIYSNLGFEALAYANGIFWTTTEHSLRKDASNRSSFGNHVPVMLRLQSFGADMQALNQYAYITDAPRTHRIPKYYAFGVPEMTVLNDSTLLVMERELSIPDGYNHSRCIISIYYVDIRNATPISPYDDIDSQKALNKTLLTRFHTGINIFGKKNYANYEGMCLGPNTADGHHTLILVADSQDRSGNSLFCLKDYIRVIVF